MRPDRKGIKTSREKILPKNFLVEMRPDRKGIKTPGCRDTGALDIGLK